MLVCTRGDFFCAASDFVTVQPPPIPAQCGSGRSVETSLDLRASGFYTPFLGELARISRPIPHSLSPLGSWRSLALSFFGER